MPPHGAIRWERALYKREIADVSIPNSAPRVWPLQLRCGEVNTILEHHITRDVSSGGRISGCASTVSVLQRGVPASPLPIPTPTRMASNSPQFKESWLPGYDDTQFYTRTYAADHPRAVLLFVHGLYDHVARYEWAHTRCAAKGVTVFTFDLRGFGRTALDTAHKSATSSYGRTDLHAQLSDMEWWVKHLHKEYPNLPLFTMGHSMGGALVLAFATRTASSPPPSQDSIALLSGVIPSSTLLLQHVHQTRSVRWAAERLRVIWPNLLYSVTLPNEYMSHDPAVGAALAADPLVIPKASIKCLTDMLDNGEALYRSEYCHWPKELPVLFLQGTADKVTSFDATRKFYENLPADDKHFIIFEDAYHELVNESNGVKEKYMDDVIAWVLERTPCP